MSMTLKDKITAWEPQAVWSEAGDGMWTVPAEKFHDLAARLRAEGFDFLRSLTGMDWGEEGFGAVYHLEASATGENVVLRTLTPSRVDYSRITGRLKTTYQAKPWMRFGANISYTHSKIGRAHV